MKSFWATIPGHWCDAARSGEDEIGKSVCVPIDIADFLNVEFYYKINKGSSSYGRGRLKPKMTVGARSKYSSVSSMSAVASSDWVWTRLSRRWLSFSRDQEYVITNLERNSP